MVLLATVDRGQISVLLQQIEEWMKHLCFQNVHLKQRQKIIPLIFPLQDFVTCVAPFLNNNILKLLFEEAITKRRFKCIHWQQSARGVSENACG